MSASLVSFIGPPASGKTTAAERLAAELNGRLVLEDYAGNPFLAEACFGRRELALPAQLYFLFSRIGQLRRLTWPDDGTVVSDYGFCQDALYAERNLSGDDLAVYRRLAEQAAGAVKPPDLLIRLDAEEDILLERIARRGRHYETTYTADLLRQMRRAYADVTASARCPVIEIDVARTDLRSPDACRALLARVEEVLP